MQTVHEADALRRAIGRWRAEGATVALVPTMGNLHAGHLALVERARAACDKVVVSIFVNPTQFGPGEDFDRYPRTLAADQARLAEHGCALVLAPTVAVMYPFGASHSVRVHVPELTATLEGACRPGHFDGVTTVVAKLLHLVSPDVAVFGRKDYQQWRVIERMVADLCLATKVIGAPIVREADGLALSSRNQYLSTAERARAPTLQATLGQLREAFAAGGGREQSEQAAFRALRDSGFVPDYVAIRRALDLALPNADERTGLIALVAARLGSTRLIDNLALD